MNAMTQITDRLPLTDDVEVDYEFNENITGDLFVEFPMNGIDQDHSVCMSCEIVLMHIGGGVTLNRDALVRIESEARVSHIEDCLREARVAA